MSREALLATWAGPARRRAAAAAVLLWLPLVAVAAALAWRLAGPGWALAIALPAIAALGLHAGRIAGRRDARWLIRRLDAHDPALEDSSGLLFAEPVPSPIAAMQRARIEARLAALDPGALAAPWPARQLGIAWAAGSAALLAILLWPAPAPAPPPLSLAAEGTAAIPGVPRLTGQRLRIVPPAYTGLPPRWSGSLDVRAPAGSRIEWALAFAPEPRSAALTLLGGQRLPLADGGDTWTAALRLDRSQLYRVVPAGGRGTPPLHRLEALPDAPPQVRAVQPSEGLTLVRPGQRSWRVVFEARDDYAVAGVAQLTVTIAQGEGENVAFRTRSMMVRGTGDPRRRRFAIDLSLAAFGMQPGSDLVAQLTVSDTRSPGPQAVRGPGVILRWPPAKSAQEGGLEMMAKRIMPAYFRSQRQIIIDTEKLIRERRGLDGDAFLLRSDTIGVDQRLLRLRYGQFVGEETEGGPKRPPLPTADAENEPAPAASATAALEDGHSADDGHDHGGAGSLTQPKVFGQSGNVAAEFGHAHDQEEAATLLPDDTRTVLRAALNEMWNAELHLRQGKPELALPYENRALNLIKQVQQASRIYLQRVGPRLPPLDPARRMTGKREGLASRSAPLSPFRVEDAPAADAWRALAGGGAVDTEALDRWVRGNVARLGDPLSLLAAIDLVRGSPGCARCRVQLRNALWSALTRPPAAARRRGDGGALGRRYLQRLR